jgi:integrase
MYLNLPISAGIGPAALVYVRAKSEVGSNMALAVNRTGVVLKKCDTSNHRPESVKRCATATCQHTCPANTIEKCPHAWTLRYWVNGRQVEKSFKDEIRNGRVAYGSGRKLAADFQLKLTVDKRSGDVTFTPHGRTGTQNFGEAAETFISRLPIVDSSRYQYRSVYRKHIGPVFGDMTLSQVANDRDGVMELLAVTMKHLSDGPRQHARHVIVGTVEEAVKAGKLSRHRLDGIELADSGRYSRKSFVFPTYSQVRFVAGGGLNPLSKRAVGGAGLSVWLMRGCGLRIEEALAVCKEDFIEDGTVLRVAWQASGDGKRREPLKHRKAGEYRDVPVPSWLWEMVRDMADGPLIPGNGKLFQRYGTIYFRFMRAAEVAGIAEGFTPHSLRHAFASAMLARGVQITELAHFLGHRDINVTHQVYGHLLPSAAKRAVAALDAEFAEWSMG